MRMRSLTNSFFGSSAFIAWFLKMTSSSQRFLTVNEAEDELPGESNVRLPDSAA